MITATHTDSNAGMPEWRTPEHQEQLKQANRAPKQTVISRTGELHQAGYLIGPFGVYAQHRNIVLQAHLQLC